MEVLKSAGTTRVWVPAALIRETPFQRTFANTFAAEGGTARMIESQPDALGIIAAEFPAGAKPVVTVVSRVATRDHAADLTAPAASSKTNTAELAHFLRPTKLIPTDGIVKETSAQITKGATTDVEKARAIYEWIVDNTFRNPKTRGCGIGDIRFMLESRDLSGKCADINSPLHRSRTRRRPPRARTSTASASRSLNSVIRASAPPPTTSRKRSTAAPKFFFTATAGFPLIPPTFAKSSLRNPPAIARSMTTW